MVSVSKRKVKTQGLKPGDSRKHSYDKCCFPLYFILTARNTILSGGYLLPHYISVSMVACEQALLGVGGGGGEGERGSIPKRACSQAIYIWGNWRCWKLSLLNDCRLYAPHSQIWPEYKLETASRFSNVYVGVAVVVAKAPLCLAGRSPLGRID